MTGETLGIRRFAREDEGWLRRWYEDPELNAQLGPIDAEWVEHVLTEQNGVELVVEREGVPVAVVGCVWAAGPEGEHVVSALSVDPALRRKGVASVALEAAMRWRGHPAHTGWLAYVDAENPAALAFFAARGWERLGIDDDMHVFRRPA